MGCNANEMWWDGMYGGSWIWDRTTALHMGWALHQSLFELFRSNIPYVTCMCLYLRAVFHCGWYFSSVWIGLVWPNYLRQNKTKMLVIKMHFECMHTARVYKRAKCTAFGEMVPVQKINTNPNCPYNNLNSHIEVDVSQTELRIAA